MNQILKVQVRITVIIRLKNRFIFQLFTLGRIPQDDYVDGLRKHKIEWMTGYAVSFYLLSKFIIEENLKVPPLKAIITTSEKLTPEMRLTMQQAFGCQVYEEYSTVENSLFASECEHGRLHVSPDVGIVEILRPDGSPCLPGEVGEVVTNMLNANVPALHPLPPGRPGGLGSRALSVRAGYAGDQRSGRAY